MSPFPSVLSLLLLFLQYSNVTSLDKFVHIDMKGAPPRPEYLKTSFELFKQLGATGVVMEWEDMFPLTGILSSASHGNAYSQSDVKSILQHANRLNLTVIPLIQTFGHVEWLLKTALFSPLRENVNYTNVLCIGDEAVTDTLSDLISQVTTLHASVSPMPFFHIGADEAVINPGQCEEDVEKMVELGTNDTKVLVFDHFLRVAKMVQDDFPETKILAWFDEFKDADPSLIKEYELDTRIIPVVWKYWSTDLDGALPDAMWLNLSLSFSSSWGASAFKGANGAARIDNAVVPYLANNQLWNDQIGRHSPLFNDSIPSIIITGWQRYDHFTGLCELLPTSMTTLAMSIIMVDKGNVTENDASFISSILSCPPSTTLVELLSANDSCQYPAYEVRSDIRSLKRMFDNFETYKYIHNLENGWFGRTQREKDFSSRYYLESLETQYKKYQTQLRTIVNSIREDFDKYYYSETASEFLFDRVNWFSEKLQRGLWDISQIDARKSFPVRPLF